MDKSIIYVFIILLTILIAGCENVDVGKVSDKDLERISEKAVVCNKPYIRIGVECCLDQNGNSICDSDETKKTQLSETELVKEYLKHISVQNIDEEIAATKESQKYVTGYAKENLNELLRFYNEQKRVFNNFYNELWLKCTKADTIEKCKEVQQKFLDNFDSTFRRDSHIIEIELNENANVHTEREEITPTSKVTLIRNYLLKKENGEWKIYDWIDDKGNKWSDVSIGETKLNIDNSIENTKKVYDWGLQNIQEQIEKIGKQNQTEIRKDKCSYLEESKGLTANELEREFQICYQGKYIDYATNTNNSKVCDEIVKPWYYSPCFASVASQKNDISLCDNIKYEEWEARGYYEKLNTKNLCYYSFVSYKYTYIDVAEIEKHCNKISDIQLKTQCLAFKELGSHVEYP